MRYGIDYGERGAYCLFGIILVRAWISKIGEHAIAHVSGGALHMAGPSPAMTR
jgi:hypothetical protein